jgi:hypothetical protein
MSCRRLHCQSLEPDSRRNSGVANEKGVKRYHCITQIPSPTICRTPKPLPIHLLTQFERNHVSIRFDSRAANERKLNDQPKVCARSGKSMRLGFLARQKLFSQRLRDDLPVIVRKLWIDTAPNSEQASLGCRLHMCNFLGCGTSWRVAYFLEDPKTLQALILLVRQGDGNSQDVVTSD